VNPWLAWGLIVALSSALVTIWWVLSGFGTPDDDEIGGDRWPRLDCPDELEP